MKNLSKALLELANHIHDPESFGSPCTIKIYNQLLRDAPEYADAFRRRLRDFDVRSRAARTNDSSIFEYPHIEFAACRDDFQDYLRAVAKHVGKKGVSPVKLPSWKKLTVKRSKSGDDFANLGNQRFRLKGRNAASFLEHLKQAEGASIKANTLEVILHERPARIFGKLPQSLQRIIDKPGRGRTGYAMH